MKAPFTRYYPLQTRVTLFLALCFGWFAGLTSDLPSTISAPAKDGDTETVYYYRMGLLTIVSTRASAEYQAMTTDELGVPCVITCAEGFPDCDGDTICDDADNCPGVANTDQLNFDGDLEGDECDLDDDNDGVDDEFDDEPLNQYACQDLDNDGCDDCSQWDLYSTPDEFNDGDDSDEDGICDLTDNCIDDSNFTQDDDDGDGVGDVCDNCPNDDNETQEDTDGDGIGDVCDDCDNAAPDIEDFNYTTCHCEPGYYEVYEDFDLGGGSPGLRVPVLIVTGCQICPPGYYCPDGVSSTPCEAGTYMDLYGAVDCYDCEDGYTSDEGATSCTLIATCDDNILNGAEEGIDCGGPDCPICPPANAVCGVITIYRNQLSPDYDGPGSVNLWLVDALDLGPTSTSSSENPTIQVKRYLSNITFDWTNGGCPDTGPNGGPLTNADKGLVYRDCYPAVIGNFNVNKLYKLLIDDEFGPADECAGTIKLVHQLDETFSVPSIHFVIPDTDEFLSIDRTELNTTQEQPSALHDLFLVPNPGTNSLRVNWNATIEGEVEIRIVDMSGRIAAIQEYEVLAGQNMVTFDMASQSAGVYAIIIRSATEVISAKWIKE